MFVRLTRDHHGLTRGRTYGVIGIEADSYRLLNDNGGPFLYDRDCFEVVDPAMPADWIVTRGDEGEIYAYPPALGRPGFFEDFHDQITEAVVAFRGYMGS